MIHYLLQGLVNYMIHITLINLIENILDTKTKHLLEITSSSDKITIQYLQFAMQKQMKKELNIERENAANNFCMCFSSLRLHMKR